MVALLSRPELDEAAEQIVRRARNRAREGLYSGQMTDANLRLIGRCTHAHLATGSRIIYSRDADSHLSGWWKNPDYARCFHLSLSYVDPPTGIPTPHNHRLSERWCRLFFGEHIAWLWCEPPYTDLGKRNGTWHFRLFADEGWQPLKPRGEVYSKRNTPAGWMSWSDVQDMRRRAGEVPPEW